MTIRMAFINKNRIKILILLVTAYAMVMMIHWLIGFTFFTQLSNLYVMLVVLAQLFSPKRRKTLLRLKFTAVVSITVTFLVFLLVLAPLDPRGMAAAYAQDHGASFCMHLLTPVLTVWDFLMHDARDGQLRNKDLPLALLPPVLYFSFILIIGVFGFRWAGHMSAPYLFLNYSAPAGWFGFMPETAGRTTLGIGVFYAVILMMVLFLLVGAALLAAARRFQPAFGTLNRDYT